MKSASERKREQRERAKAAGLCAACCKEPATKGTKCEGCAAAAYEAVKRRRERVAKA